MSKDGCLFLSHTHTHAHTHTHTQLHSLSLSHTHTHTHIHDVEALVGTEFFACLKMSIPFSLTHTHMHTHTYAITISLSRTHTHTQTHTHTYTQVMWKHLWEQSFPMSEDDYNAQLDAVAWYLSDWG